MYEGASVTMNSKSLNGSQRVVVDGVLSAEECRELQRLTNVSTGMRGCRGVASCASEIGWDNVGWALQAAASAGDGYRGKTSPHTPSETFYGVTVLKALKVSVAAGAWGCCPAAAEPALLSVPHSWARRARSPCRAPTSTTT